MALSGSDAPAWLFSFVDLAFLLLIAMTQIGGEPDAVDLGEMSVPRVAEAGVGDLPAGAPLHWQLRVHPPRAAQPPFELAGPGAAAPLRLAAPELRQRLQGLRAQRARRPLLAPHPDSRSQDLLEAAGLIEEQWPGRRRATVAPVFAWR